MGNKAVPSRDLIKTHLRLASAQQGKQPPLTLEPAMLGVGVSATFPVKNVHVRHISKSLVRLEMLGEVTCHVAQPL